jgi:5-methylcytosine-specific restriction endonuclease McrA
MRRTGNNLQTNAASGSTLVKRSQVEPGKHYREYLESLRQDFTYSCAYCGTTEFEAQGIRMVIDHYEPRVSRPDLNNEYSNLMYCCDPCNEYKGDRSPPAQAREKGVRFFRVDHDYRHEHFRGTAEPAYRIAGITLTGEFTVEYLDLNRASLVRLRRIRDELTKCHEFVLHGIRGLNQFSIDRLPPEYRMTAYKRIQQWQEMAEKIADDADKVLCGIAYSGMLNRDPEKDARAASRAATDKRLDGLFPGQSWRGRTQKRRK